MLLTSTGLRDTAVGIFYDTLSQKHTQTMQPRCQCLLQMNLATSSLTLPCLLHPPMSSLAMPCLLVPALSP